MKKIIFATITFLSFAISSMAQDISGPPLTIEEVDTSPSVTFPTKLIFPNSSLSVTGQEATVDLFTQTEILELIAGGNFDYFLNDTVSVGAYLTMSATPTGEAESTFSDEVTSDAFLIDSFLTPAAEPTFTTISAGVYSLHFHADVDAVSASIDTIRIYYVLYKYEADTTETLISTSEESDILTATKTAYNIHCIHGETTIGATDRLLVKVYANIEDDNATNADANIYAEGVNATRFSVLTSIDVFDTRYINATGDTGTGVYDFGTSVEANTLTEGGNAVYSLGESPTFADITLSGASILANATASGILTLGGTGGATNNENLTFDFETTANTVEVGSGTGVTTTVWDGDFVLQEEGDARVPGISDTDPHLRVYSSDATVATDYIEMYHDQTDGIIATGSGGDIILDSAAAVILDSGRGTDAITAFAQVGTNLLAVVTDSTDAEARLATYDAAGNFIIITSVNNFASDHDHAVQTNPTLFIHSDLNPDTSNNQWGSFAHDQENFVITTGANTGVGSAPTTDDNAIVFAPRGTEAIRITGDGNLQGDPLADQMSYIMSGRVKEIITSANLIGLWEWITPATTEQDLTSNDHDATYQTMTTGDQLNKGLVWSLDFDGGDDQLTILDHADFTFSVTDTDDQPCSFGGWVEVVLSAGWQSVVGKWDDSGGAQLREWLLQLDNVEKLNFYLYDESLNKLPYAYTTTALSAGWHFVVATYDGGGGATAANGITIYIDGISVALTVTNNVDYVAMENTTTTPTIGSNIGTATPWQGDMGFVFVANSELTAQQIWDIFIGTRGYYNE